jgi:CMP/dCMP kinase
MIIVIDGPAGSGKSSSAKAIANRLNIQFLDSGALYRALTYLWIEAGKPDKAEFFEICRNRSASRI